ncbi:uncharacterized protein BDZ99DRAFT_550193 [Mytilinidion resinicola]|uniref:Uncharacterized protein n=1 Tax=Mytilinidion resinicola TaxID=574789 RepID=A0A6A6Z5E2_9PEZI|nr:uncharacterized protein BDZ99DRAFT_550193 [Mytilinidion resinicola]KAF2815405.1 hypothetical protein BDZ99DRAFT_550193 [Mytilinidion resinicola]
MDVLQRFLPATKPISPTLLDRHATPIPPGIETTTSSHSRDHTPENAERDENRTSPDVTVESKPSSPIVMPPIITIIGDSDESGRSSSSDAGLAEHRIDSGDISDHTIQNHDHRTLIPRTLPRDAPRRKAGRQRLRGTSSNSGIESISRYKQKVDEVKVLEQEVRELRISPSGTPPHRPWKLKRVSTAPGLCEKHITDGNIHGEPRFVWIPSTLSRADTSCQTADVTPSEKSAGNDCSTPLRACLSQSPKNRTSSPSSIPHKPIVKNSAIGSPPSGLTGKRRKHGHQRTKAVDFDSPTSLFMSSVSKLKSWVAEKDSAMTADPEIEIAKAVSFIKPRSKSKAADSAVTRTDVHVVAISAPEDDASLKKPRKLSATPTKQIVQTDAGAYGVVWDDPPTSSSDNETRRRGSDAGQALEAASSTGLEGVDTKLSDWSWRTLGSFDQATRRDRKPSHFVPNIVVFPDDSYQNTVPAIASGRHTYLRHTASSTLDSSSDAEPSAAPLQSSSLLPRRDPPPPPNSASSSGLLLPRRSPSAGRNSPSRTTSTTDSSLSSTTSDLHQAAFLPPPPSPSADHPSWPRAKKDSLFPSASDEHLHLTSTHRLSHIDNLHFRTHKDSLAVARAKWERKYSQAMGLVGAGGVDPERFRGRCSVAIARKRMKGRREVGRGRLESLSEGGGVGLGGGEVRVATARAGEMVGGGEGRVVRIVE